jgi:hypothetical protein
LRGTNKTLAPTPGFTRPGSDFPTPVPTPCTSQQFWFDGNECTNTDFPQDSFFGYNTLAQCCNAEFGQGSLNDGSCEYTDICGEPPMSMDYILESFGRWLDLCCIFTDSE